MSRYTQYNEKIFCTTVTIITFMLKKLSHTIKVKGSELREIIKSKKRSSHWDEVRDAFIEENPRCSACGSMKKLQVHHIIPFNHEPEKELDPTNLTVLCMDTNECHLSIGHGGSFAFYNPDVIVDAKEHLAAENQKRKLIIETAKKKRLK